jgi:hypothetical protein
MDFNLIRCWIENELEGDERSIMLVLDYVEHDSELRKKAFFFMQGIYQSIALNIKRHRRMVLSWSVHGNLVVVIESLQDAKYRGKE